GINEQFSADLKALTSIVKSSSMSKSAKEAISALVPELTTIVTKVVSSAVATAVDKLTEKITSEFEKKSREQQRFFLLNHFETNKIEQMQRSNNVRIVGLRESQNETSEELEAKVIEVGRDIGMDISNNDISVAHRLGKPQEQQTRTTLVTFCLKKKKDEFYKKRSQLREKKKDIYINEDLTALKASMLKMVKEQPSVKGTTTRDGTILAWINNENRPVYINTPDDLTKVGIESPDLSKLRLPKITAAPLA
ncbi:hypothetical protein SNEBB_010921, partial [Seison nebaliae]